jgi:hypothetical protein
VPVSLSIDGQPLMVSHCRQIYQPGKWGILLPPPKGAFPISPSIYWAAAGQYKDHVDLETGLPRCLCHCQLLSPVWGKLGKLPCVGAGRCPTFQADTRQLLCPACPRPPIHQDHVDIETGLPRCMQYLCSFVMCMCII